MTEDQKERYKRHIVLDGVGAEGQERLLAASVLIVGAGGLGSPIALYLTAAGISRIGIIDADNVDVSNLQRQVIHFTDDRGKSKVESAKEKMSAINPDITVDAINVFFCKENAEELIKQYDFIVDAIDTIAPKCALLGEALRRGIPIVSSMGAGAKSDITQIRFADLWDTYHCGLAKAVRTRLKKEGLRRSLPVVFSTEQADRRAVITVEGEQNKKSTAGTISYMPAVFGCYLAEYVIRKL
jgi:tRNA A37 threonylcarbamoyladenosine dehydratase